MTNTTPSAICAAFETLIAAMTPSGGTDVGEMSSYTVIEDTDYAEDPLTLAESEMDRAFAVHGIEPTDVVTDAASTHAHMAGRMEIAIGHMIADYRDARDRRDKDLHQIILQLIRVGGSDDNRPTGVLLVKYHGVDISVVRDGQYWWSKLLFEIQYFTDPDYGG